ncbi:MAG: polysaccharide biosynthesis protein [Clostridiales bacterium]|nr:polysaccharide biosynthesis protein [Clostridiales bacterium]
MPFADSAVLIRKGMGMTKGKKQNFLSGAVILTGAVAIVKVIGALYKIPLGNILDREGMAHFYVAYNIYNLLLILSTAGLPLAMSRLVSEASALGRENQKHRILQVGFGLFLLLGLLFSGIMFFFTGPISHMLHDSLAYWSIKALSPAVLCVCLMSAVRGYTQGEGNMLPTAASEIIEALCKLLVGLTLAWYLLSRGAPSQIGAAGAIVGVTVGTAAGFLALLWYLLRRRHSSASRDTPDTRLSIFRRILSIGVPITIGAGGLSLITLLDQSVVMGCLQNTLGLSEHAAASLYGEYTFGMTLFSVPPSFVYPVVISLVPAIGGALARGNELSAARSATSAFRVVALLALPAGAGLSVLAGPILNLLYPAVPETAAAAAYHLQILGIASIFVCMMVLTNGILQAYGKEYVPIFTLLAGGVMKVVVNYLMVGNPQIGIKGAPVGTLYCYVLITILNLIAIRRYVPRRPDYYRIFGKPLLATAVMSLCAWGGHSLLSQVIPERAATALAVLLAAGIYLALILLLRVISREDLEMLPKGDKIARFLHIY